MQYVCMPLRVAAAYSALFGFVGIYIYVCQYMFVAVVRASLIDGWPRWSAPKYMLQGCNLYAELCRGSPRIGSLC